MNFTLSQLQVFLKVVETQSVTKASEALHLTQPAVSIQLRKFQEQFDIPLTEVVGRKLYITDFGKEIADAAEQILQQVNAINYKTHAHKGQLFGHLRVSVVSTGKYVMPYFLSDFVNGNPGVELQMDVTNKLKVLESLQHNEIDFALVSSLPEHLNIEHLDLLQNKLYLVGNASHELPEQPLNAQDLGCMPLIFREQGSGTRQTMERFIDVNRIDVSKKLELTSNEAVKQSILAGLGYSVMPLIGIRNEILKGELKIIPMRGLPFRSSWSLVWLKGKRHGPVAQAFLEQIRTKKEEIVAKHFSWSEQFS
jgi:DNA-binding transcriptional LysR family regulator